MFDVIPIVCVTSYLSIYFIVYFRADNMTEFKKLALVLLLFVALSRASDSEVVLVTAEFT